MADGLVQGISKLVKVLFVEVNFGLDETAVIKTASFAFGYGDVEILITGSFHVKEIRALSGPNPLGENIFLIVREAAIVVVHIGFLLRPLFQDLNKYAKIIQSFNDIFPTLLLFKLTLVQLPIQTRFF